MEKLLPPEIVLDIFYRLSPESVVQCKLVCKSWYSFLPGGDNGNNYFANMHRQHHDQQRNLDDYSSLNFISLNEFKVNKEEEESRGGGGVGEFYFTKYDQVEGLKCKLKRLTFSFSQIGGGISGGGRSSVSMTRELVGSCNGLLCFTITNDFSMKARIYICNPLLHEYVILPLSDLQSKLSKKCCLGTVITGFGHNPITDEYKVVRVFYPHHWYYIGDVEVYTLGGSNGGAAGGMWRSKGGTIEYRLRSGSRPVFINGSIHWLADNSTGSEQFIASFDLEIEEFRVIPLPSNLNTSIEQLKELRGCLCLIGDRLSLGLDYINLDIWVLKDYMNPKEESWVKEFSIEWEGAALIYSPCAIIIKKKKKDGNGNGNGNGDEIIMWCNSMKLVSYDPNTRSCKEVRDGRFFIIEQDPVLHINSLVSLKALGEDAKESSSSKIKDFGSLFHFGGLHFH